MYVVLIRYFWYDDIALVKPVGYMGRPAMPGAIEFSTVRGDDRADLKALLEDFCHKWELLMTGVSECG